MIDYTFKEKLKKINSVEDPDKLVYEWIKTGYLSLAEYKKVLESPSEMPDLSHDYEE